MAGVVHIPWYATVFRGDKFEAALEQIAAARAALRRDATTASTATATTATSSCRWPRSRTSSTSSATGTAPEFSDWRRDYSSWYQVPVVYAWNDLVISGGIPSEQQPEPVGDVPLEGGMF